MADIQLLNLSIGDVLPSSDLAERRIGPFHVRIIPAYQAAVGNLTKSAQVKLAWEAHIGGPLERTIQRAPAVAGGWVETAIASVSDDCHEQSILGRTPIDDKGLFDLCQILSFVTGRSVTTADFANRYNPATKGESFCPPMGTLPVAEFVWNHRQELVNRKCNYAMLTHNRAFNTWALHELASNYNTALNVIVDNWPFNKPSIPKLLRESLSTLVTAAVDSCDELSPEYRDAYKALLSARVMQGPASLIDQVVNLLVGLEVVSEPPSTDQRTRIQFVNAVRNKLTHSGQMPALKGLTQEQADRYTNTIIAGVVPGINRVAIARLLGIVIQEEQWLIETRDELKTFFSTGVWRNWPLETADFHEWVESLAFEQVFGLCAE